MAAPDRDDAARTHLRRPTVLVVGPLPPPVHGAAAVTEAVRDVLERSLGPERVVVLDRDPSGSPWAVLAGVLAVCRAVLGRSVGTLYLSAAGSWGNVKLLPPTAVARLARRRIVVHHHSFAYLDRGALHAHLLLRLAGRRAHHVVLCERMGTLLRERYRSVRTVTVVSNREVVPLPVAPGDGRERHGRLRIGLLSNLCAVKGLDLVLATWRRALELGADLELHLVGPAADEPARVALEALADDPRARWHGPLYGADRDELLRTLDVFLFPSIYVHEAEPLVVFEAAGAGARVFTTDCGCLPERTPEVGGEAFPADRYVEEVGRRLVELAAAPARMVPRSAPAPDPRTFVAAVSGDPLHQG